MVIFGYILQQKISSDFQCVTSVREKQERSEKATGLSNFISLNITAFR